MLYFKDQISEKNVSVLWGVIELVYQRLVLFDGVQRGFRFLLSMFKHYWKRMMSFFV